MVKIGWFHEVSDDEVAVDGAGAGAGAVVVDVDDNVGVDEGDVVVAQSARDDMYVAMPAWNSSKREVF